MSHFDLVYGISGMTHLSKNAQIERLRELKRRKSITALTTLYPIGVISFDVLEYLETKHQDLVILRKA